MKIENNTDQNSYLMAAASGHCCWASPVQSVCLDAFKRMQGMNYKIDRILQGR